MMVVSHPVGSTFVRAALSAFEQAGRLKCFHTTVAARHPQRLRFMPRPVAEQLRRRTYPLPPEKILTRPWIETRRLVGNKFGWVTGSGLVNEVFEDLDQHVAGRLANHQREGASIVYAYEDGASKTFARAGELGMRCIYELPIAYWQFSQRLMAEESERWPEWKITMQGTRDSEAKLARKDEELRLCETVVCCSQFVLDTLPQWVREQKKCVVAEFGSETKMPLQPAAVRDDSVERPLRVLFAGSLSQRKGLADLFAAMKMLQGKSVELVVIGKLMAPMTFYRQQLSDFTYEETRPHDKVMELMLTCDVMVLPSLVEGRALVQQEAMSCGLPLIVTHNAGGADLIDEAQTGFLVPVRSPETIAQKIEWFLENRKSLPAMRKAAREKAALYTWREYGRKILSAVDAGDCPPVIV